MAARTKYPLWMYYPSRQKPMAWANELIEVVAAAQDGIDSTLVQGLQSDGVLGQLRPGMEALGYEVEAGKKKVDKIERPVLFGEGGEPLVNYEVDAWHEDLGVVVEIEAGRGARGNAVYRDLIRCSLVFGARFLALGVMAEYRHQSGGKQIVVHSYRDTMQQLDAVFASNRLTLPFEGVLLFGY